MGRVIIALALAVALVINVIKGGGILLKFILNGTEIIEIIGSNSSAQEDAIATVVIDPGHGGDDVGANVESLDLYESEINLIAAQAMASYLRNNNVYVVMTRTTDTALAEGKNDDLVARAAMSAEYDTDYFISLHVNDYDGENSISGYEIYVDGSSESESLAQCILAQMDTLNYADNRGTIDGTDLAVIYNNTVPSILIEMGYIQSDYDYIGDNDKLKALAQAMAQGVLDKINGGTVIEDASADSEE